MSKDSFACRHVLEECEYAVESNFGVLSVSVTDLSDGLLNTDANALTGMTPLTTFVDVDLSVLPSCFGMD